MDFVDPLTTITVVFFYAKKQEKCNILSRNFQVFRHHSTRIFDIFRYDIHVDFNTNNTKHHEI